MNASTFGSIDGTNKFNNCNTSGIYQGNACDITDNPKCYVYPGCNVTEGIAQCENWPIPDWPLLLKYKIGNCVKRSFQGSLLNVVMIKRRVTSNLGNFKDDMDKIEASPHNMAHDFLGGTMANTLSSAFDPLFWLHHSNVDKWFSLYQNYKGHDKITSVDARAGEHGPINLDRPLLYYGGGDIPQEASHFFYAPGTNTFPTSRQVLLNDDLVKVTYAEDEMVERLRHLFDDDKLTRNNYEPNSDWFTLPPTNLFAHEDENTWDHPALEVLWDGFIKKGLSASDALYKLEEEICPDDNPIMVSQELIKMMNMDAEDFRCHDVSDGGGSGGGGRPGKQPASKAGKGGKGSKGRKGRLN